VVPAGLRRKLTRRCVYFLVFTNLNSRLLQARSQTSGGGVRVPKAQGTEARRPRAGWGFGEGQPAPYPPARGLGPGSAVSSPAGSRGELRPKTEFGAF